jgi:hypothetical protein
MTDVFEKFNATTAAMTVNPIPETPAPIAPAPLVFDNSKLIQPVRVEFDGKPWECCRRIYNNLTSSFSEEFYYMAFPSRDVARAWFIYCEFKENPDGSFSGAGRVARIYESIVEDPRDIWDPRDPKTGKI